MAHSSEFTKHKHSRPLSRYTETMLLQMNSEGYIIVELDQLKSWLLRKQYLSVLIPVPEFALDHSCLRATKTTAQFVRCKSSVRLRSSLSYEIQWIALSAHTNLQVGSRSMASDGLLGLPPLVSRPSRAYKRLTTTSSILSALTTDKTKNSISMSISCRVHMP